MLKSEDVVSRIAFTRGQQQAMAKAKLVQKSKALCSITVQFIPKQFLPGQFISKQFIPRQFIPWDSSYPDQFIPRTVHTWDSSYPGTVHTLRQFIPRKFIPGDEFSGYELSRYELSRIWTVSGYELSLGMNCLRVWIVSGYELSTKNRSKIAQATLPQRNSFNPENIKKLPIFKSSRIGIKN